MDLSLKPTTPSTATTNSSTSTTATAPGLSALGLLTNTEPIRITDVKPVKDESNASKKEPEEGSCEKIKDETKLIFFGTFFHDSNELNADLVQIKEPTRIKEIRVIPLGATVNLSNGSFQLGATNPSELELEFYYNDLQVPSKSAFTLLQNFSFNDKLRIQLNVGSEELIITDGLIVRGVYSTITLAVYGCSVDEVPIKALHHHQQVNKTEVVEQSVGVVDSKNGESASLESGKKNKFEEDKEGLLSKVEVDRKVKVEEEVDDDDDDVGELFIDENVSPGGVECEEGSRNKVVDVSNRSSSTEEPKPIPTITTSSREVEVKSKCGGEVESKGKVCDELIDRGMMVGEVVSDLSSDDDGEGVVVSQPIAVTASSFNTSTGGELAGLEDAEDISDAEVFPEEEDDDDNVVGDDDDDERVDQDNKIAAKELDSSVLVTSGSSPAIEPLSDQEDSMLLDEFRGEVGVEEIISDEEMMPDFPEYEYGELGDELGVWGSGAGFVFGGGFNPFSDSFKIGVLKHFKVSQTFGPVAKTEDEMVKLLECKAGEWCKDNFDFGKIEGWVMDMEELVSVIPRVCGVDTSEGIKETLFYWTTVGLDLKLAKSHSQLPFKTRHIKVGIKLVHALSITQDERIVEELLDYNKRDVNCEGSNNGTTTTTVLDKLIDIFKEEFMSTTMRLSVLRALDCMVLSKVGFRAFVGGGEEEGGEEFFDEDCGSSEVDGEQRGSVIPESCYEKLVTVMLDKGMGTRVSFGIHSFLNKVKLLEDLGSFEKFVLGIVKNSSSELSTSVEAQDVDDCVNILENLRDLGKKVGQYLGHPVRVLPGRGLVELPGGEGAVVPGHDPRGLFVKSLREYQFVKCCTVLVNNKDLCGRTGGLVSEIVSVLLSWEVGLVYLCGEGESSSILLRTLAQLLEDDGVALYACHCLEVIKCVDRVVGGLEGLLEDGGESLSNKTEDIACLQTLVSFLATPLGRQALACTLTIGDLISPLLDCLKRDCCVRRGYACKIVGFIVRNGEDSLFLKKHGSNIYDIITSMENDDEGLNGNISSVTHFLRPVLDPHLFTLDGIEELFGVVKSSVDSLMRFNKSSGSGVKSNWGVPPELTSAVRVLCGQVVPPSSDDAKNCIPSDVDHMLIKELKYDIALVKLHSLDVISTFTTIIQKIIDDFNGKPWSQSYTFVSERGDALVNLISPVVKIIRRVISQVVHVRKTDFKDTTAVPVLLNLYTITESIPPTAPCYKRSREVSQNIIGTLLSYTIPALRQGVETEEELNKSTWTAVISEILNYTMEEPATFITGVSIFSELLPLPLPIASKIPLTESECTENVKLRRLWSAYIHGLSSQIQEMIGVLCSSTNSKLITVLKRLCVQLADLSGSTCMVVCRAVLDSVSLSIENDMESQQSTQQSDQQQQQLPQSISQTSSIKAWLDQSKPPKLLGCSSNTARLLGFLSSLINNSGTIKTGIMQALRGVLKLDEKYTDLITQFCCMVTSSSTTSLSTTHVQAQENIITIFQSLCDQEINLIVPMYGYSGKIYDSKFVLANSLPPKDLFITISNTLINYVGSTPYRFPESRVMEGVLRGLEIIAETEYGFYHMRNCIEKVPGLFRNILVTLADIDLTKSDTFEAAWSCISSIVELFRSLTSPRHGTGSNVTNRGSILTRQEFKVAVDWNGNYPVKKESGDDDDDEDDDELDSTDGMEIDEDVNDNNDEEEEDEQKVSFSNPTHPLTRLFKLLQKLIARLNKSTQRRRNNNNNQVTVEATEVKATNTMLASVLEYLEDDKEQFETIPETILPVPDLLQELFSKRPVFVIVEKLGSENLPPFWLTSIPPAFDLDSEYSETVVCDLGEICSGLFPDVDVVKEIERFYKSSNDGGVAGTEDSKTNQQSGPAGSGERANKMIKLDVLGKSIVGLGGLTPHHHHHHHHHAHHHHRKPFGSHHLRGGLRGFGRGIGGGGSRGLDPFRSRPPNTSRPPSLHVDDFVALESSGQSGSVAAAYNKGGVREGSFGNSNRGSSNVISRGNSSRGRPYGDRGGRFRGSPGGSYFSSRRGSRGGGMIMGGINKHHGGGGGGPGGSGDPRWGDSPRGGGNSDSYHRNRYEDKFSSRGGSPGMRSSLGSSSSSLGRGGGYMRNNNSYREAPPNSNNGMMIMRGNSNSSPDGGGNNPGLRWRDRRRVFNR